MVYRSMVDQFIAGRFHAEGELINMHIAAAKYLLRNGRVEPVKDVPAEEKVTRALAQEEPEAEKAKRRRVRSSDDN